MTPTSIFIEQQVELKAPVECSGVYLSTLETRGKEVIAMKRQY